MSKHSWLKTCLRMAHDYLPGRLYTAEDSSAFLAVAPHVLSIADLSCKSLASHSGLLCTANVYDAVGYCYGAVGEYALAIELCDKALKIYIAQLGTQSPTVAALNNNIGEVYNDWGITDKAYDYYYAALIVRKRVYGIRNEFTA